LLYYRVYNTNGPIATKCPAYQNDANLGRIKSNWVTPPYHADSLKRCLSMVENIDPSNTRLFAKSSSQSALAGDTPISFNTLGLTPEEPLALFCEVAPQDGVKPGTESFRVSPDAQAQSPLSPRFLYYGVYTQDGVSVSKNPIYTEEPWISRIDLELIPPSLSIVSLIRSITLNEGINSPSSQIFADKNAMIPLCDDHILTEDGDWPGSTADDHVIFKFVRQHFMTFDGSKYQVQNCSTGRIMFLNSIYGGYLRVCGSEWISAKNPWYEFVFKIRDDGVAFQSTYSGDWIGANFEASKTEHSFYFVCSETDKDCFSICSDPNLGEACHDSHDLLPSSSSHYPGLEWKKFDANDQRQLWRLLPV